MSHDNVDINKELIENGIKENAYAELEQNYHQLINEVASDSSTEKFRDEIEKLFRTFQIAQANEKILIRMLRDLKKKYQEDAHLLNKMREQQIEDKRELDNYKKLEKQLQSSTQEKREMHLRAEFSVADKIKDEFVVDEGQIEDLKKEILAHKRVNEQMRMEFDKLQKEINDINTSREKLEIYIKELQAKNKDLSQNLDNEVQMNIKKIQEKEIKITQLNEHSSKIRKENEEKEFENKNLTNANNELKLKLADTKKKIEELENGNKGLEQINEKIAKKIEDEKKDKKIVLEREKSAFENIKLLEAEKEKLDRVIIEKENYLKEKDRMIAKANREKLELETKIYSLTGEINSRNDEIEKYKSLRDDEMRLKDKEKSSNRKKETEIRNLNELIKELENHKIKFEESNKSLSSDLANYKVELDKANKLNQDLERNRDKITEENTKLKNKIDHLYEDIRLRDNRVQELVKKVSESEKKMKMQREVYDAVRRDKNLYFKNLIETQDDLIDKQNLLQFNKKEIENLKSDLKKKDDYIVNLKSKNSNFEDTLKTKQLENDKLKLDFEGTKQICATQEKEIEKLKIEGLERAKDYKKVDAEYKKTIIDRDNISSQLIRRNDEVSLLHEKIMILTSNLSKSEREFQENKESINKLNNKIRSLEAKLDISKNYKIEAKNFAKEIINLNKELLREKNLNKALTEEVESSEKIFHRWRKLEGIDPDSLEMHYKINLLQKRLITKTEETVEKEITIQDLTKELANLKKTANKRPTFEIEESIKLYKQELAKQYEKMKSVIAERNMFENQVEDVKADNNKLKKENTDIQMRYHELKLRQNKKKE